MAPRRELVQRLKDGGVVVMPSIGAKRHAEKVAEWGVDAVIVQGGEGGGHTGSVPTSLLLPQVVDTVDIPVIAAGGFFDGRGLVAALAYGAAGIAMGTRFLLTKDSMVPDAVKELYLSKSVSDTVVTKQVDGWPHRVLRTEFVEHLERTGAVTSLPRAVKNAFAFKRLSGTPLADITQPMPFGAVQQAFDEFFRRGTLRSYWKSTYVNKLTDEIIDILVPKAQNRPSKRTFVVLFLMGGQINRVGGEDTAYSERSADWMVSIDGNWESAAEDDKVVSWVRDTWSQVHKLGTGTTYLNFTGIADEATDVGVASAFGRNLKKLAQIKKKYDPNNFFRLNNNITPA